MTTFTVGCKVAKTGGDYIFNGTVVAVFKKLTGSIGYVVEDKRGLLFIFNAEQLTEDRP